MVTAETLFSYPDWKIIFAVHTNASDKQLGAVISQNIKPIALLSKILRGLKCKYTTTKNSRMP